MCKNVTCDVGLRQIFKIFKSLGLKILICLRLKDVFEANNAKDIRTVIMIDEVHKNPDDPMFIELLKRAKYQSLMVLGVGVSRLTTSSPFEKHKPREILLNSSEVKELSNLWFKVARENVLQCEFGEVEEFCEWVAEYEGL